MAAKWARVGGILPTYTRYVDGVPVLERKNKKTLGIREKYVILVVLVTLITVCTSAFLFFPTFLRDRSQNSGSGFNGLFLTQRKLGHDHVHLEKQTLVGLDTDSDESKVQFKSERREEQNKLNGKLDEVQRINDEAIHIRSKIEAEKEIIVNKLKEESERKKLLQMMKSMKVNLDHGGYPGTTGGEPLDSDVKAKRDKIKEMMLHAWRGYEQNSWGANEHRPISRMQHVGGIFGGDHLGTTIVDAVDTLYIMGLYDEYKKARNWIAQSLNFDIPADLSVFETTIRYVGGLLSAYAFTGDQVFKNKARDIADRLLPAFNTPTGLPFAVVNVKAGSSYNYGWASECSILADVGSLHLEFDYLSTVTGDSVYRDKVMKIRTFLKDITKLNGLYSNFIHPVTGKWGQQQISVGALGDSFFEYLLKEWLISNRKDTEARQMYDDAMKAIFEHTLVKSQGGLTYLAEFKFGHLEHKMDHFTCFSSGMIGMSAEGSNDKEKYLNIAEEIAHTCHESYARTATGLGPEIFHFEGSTEAKAVNHNEKSYILRPEVLEGWFYLWRLTKKQKYRDWAWDMVQALEENCRVEGGYSGIFDVYQKNPQKDDVQQSFFLAETLKYLYLIFSEDDLLPLEKWVFNTEAHPLPVKGITPAEVNH